MGAYEYLSELRKPLAQWRERYVDLEAMLQPDVSVRQGDGPMAHWIKLASVGEMVKRGETLSFF